MIGSLVRAPLWTARATYLLASSRGIQTTFLNREIVTAQDMKDFQKYQKEEKKPVLFDFFATWCGPCRTLTPRLESTMKQYEGKVVLVKVDIDKLEDAAMMYKVKSVPTVVGLISGKERNRFVGVQEEADIKKFVDHLLTQ